MSAPRSAGDVAAAERNALADLFLERGPDEPTLAGEWTTNDLLAHLVIRERRPDAAPGILIPPLSFWTRACPGPGRAAGLRRQRRADPQRPAVVEPDGAALPRRRGRPGVLHPPRGRAPRRRGLGAAAPGARRATGSSWKQLGLLGKLVYRSSPVGVTLRAPDGREHAAKSGPRPVTIVGEPGELVIYTSGREQAVVSFEGEPADVATVKGLDRGL